VTRISEFGRLLLVVSNYKYHLAGYIKSLGHFSFIRLWRFRIVQEKSLLTNLYYGLTLNEKRCSMILLNEKLLGFYVIEEIIIFDEHGAKIERQFV